MPHSFQCIVLSLSLVIRENSRGHAHGLWLRKLANSASWHATAGDIRPFLLHRLPHLPHGYWAPQVRQLEVPATTLVSLQVCLSHSQSAFTPQLDLLTCQTQVSAGYCKETVVACFSFNAQKKNVPSTLLRLLSECQVHERRLAHAPQCVR